MNLKTSEGRAKNIFDKLGYQINHERALATAIAKKGFYVSKSENFRNEEHYILQCFGCRKTFSVTSDNYIQSIKEQLVESLSNREQNKLHTFSCSIQNPVISPATEIEHPESSPYRQNCGHSSETASISTATNDDKCAICMDRPLDKVALIPCGHANICGNCREEDGLLKIEECPMCRQTIIGTLPVYFGGVQ